MTATALGRRAGLAAAGGIALGLVLGLASGAAGEARLALVLAGSALAAFLAAPWRAAAAAAAGAARPWAVLTAGAETLALLAGAGAAGLLAGCPAGPLAGGLLFAFSLALGLAGLGAAAGPRAGQPLATALGLLGLALPDVAEPVRGLTGDAWLLARVVASPLPILCGSFAGFDLLRSRTAYQVFAPGQGLPYAYPSPAEALLGAAALAAVGCALALAPALARHLRRGEAARPPLATGALVALLLLAAAPEEARAQAIFEPTPAQGEGEIGDLQTRVQLGYYLPLLDGFIRKDSQTSPSVGSRLDFERTLDLDPLFVMPTFEVGFAWQNAGRIIAQYLEGEWHGETQSFNVLRFEEQVIAPRSIMDVRYRYRTVALRGELDVPLFEWATLKIITTQRYVKHELRLRAFAPGGARVTSTRDSLEALVPTIGAGAEVYVWGVITAYGDIQWLDFRTSIFGGESNRWDLRYREWRAGVRLELVEHAHVMVEWYSFYTRVRKGSKGLPGRVTYDQTLDGVRLQVAILF